MDRLNREPVMISVWQFCPILSDSNQYDRDSIEKIYIYEIRKPNSNFGSVFKTLTSSNVLKTLGELQQICHRDLKLENTLLDGSPAPRLKICDFGYSKVVYIIKSNPLF